MKIHTKFTGSVTCLLSILAVASVSPGLVSCSSDHAAEQAAVNTIEQKIEPTSDKKTITTTVRNHHSKPGAGVVIKYTVPAKINIGDTIDIELNLSVSSGAGELTVEARPEGVELLTHPSNQTFSFIGKSEHKMPLSVYCAEAGRFYLNVFVARSTEHGQFNRQQTLSIPIQVGDAVLKKPSTENMLRDAEGNLIQSMPAKETISEAGNN